MLAYLQGNLEKNDALGYTKEETLIVIPKLKY